MARQELPATGVAGREHGQPRPSSRLRDVPPDCSRTLVRRLLGLERDQEFGERSLRLDVPGSEPFGERGRFAFFAQLGKVFGDQLAPIGRRVQEEIDPSPGFGVVLLPHFAG